MIFNYRLSRARRIIENTFGILAARFRIFRRPILSCLETVENIIKACVALHNYLMANKKFGETNSYCPNGFINQDVQRNGEWREIVIIHGMQKLCEICFVITLIHPKGQYLGS